MTAAPDSMVSPQQAAVDAALLALKSMGLSLEDLTGAPSNRKPAPTFAEYVPVVAATVTKGTLRAYRPYWRKVVEQWGERPIDEPTPSEVKQLYLGDACALRNRLAHVGTTDGVRLRSQFFVKSGRSALPQMTLMLAEGLLQATQDIAYLAMKATGPAAALVTGDWEWVLPRPSATSTMSAQRWRHAAFPLDA